MNLTRLHILSMWGFFMFCNIFPHFFPKIFGGVATSPYLCNAKSNKRYEAADSMSAFFVPPHIIIM